MRRFVIICAAAGILLQGQGCSPSGGSSDGLPATGTPPPPKEFPADAFWDGTSSPPNGWIVNVKSAPWNAKGDGVTDDTAAIQQAVTDALNSQNTNPTGFPLNNAAKCIVIYFPAGTYKVSNTLWPTTVTNPTLVADDTAPNYQWRAYLWYQGAHRDTTTIKLDDNLPAFNNPVPINPAASYHDGPKGVLYLASAQDYRIPTSPPTYNLAGTLQRGFSNYVRDLTIDTGSGNAYAVGIDLIANNSGGVRDVTVRGSGFAGIRMDRPYPGPLLIKNVSVNGFQYGIRTAHQQSEVVLKDVTVVGQTVAGIYNRGIGVFIENLKSLNTVPAILNAAGGGMGLMSIVNSTLDGNIPNNPNAAIVNDDIVDSTLDAHLFASNVTYVTYGTGIQSNDTLENGTNGIISQFVSQSIPTLWAGQTYTTLGLTVPTVPTVTHDPVEQWVNVATYGAVKDNSTFDNTPAFQAAIDACTAANGKTTVYVPRGSYLFKTPVLLRGNVKRVVFFSSRFGPTSDWSGPAGSGVFELVDSPGSAQTICLEAIGGGWFVSPPPATPPEGFVHKAMNRTLIFRHGGGGGLFTAGSGDVFLEDVMTGGPDDKPYIKIGTGINMYGWQVNPESLSTDEAVWWNPMIENWGGTLRLLGVKTEGKRTVIKTTTQTGSIGATPGQTELLGAFLFPSNFPLGPAYPSPDQYAPAFVNHYSRQSLVYLVSNYKGDNPNDPNNPGIHWNYQRFVEEKMGAEIRSDYPEQGLWADVDGDLSTPLELVRAAGLGKVPKRGVQSNGSMCPLHVGRLD